MLIFFVWNKSQETRQRNKDATTRKQEKAKIERKQVRKQEKEEERDRERQSEKGKWKEKLSKNKGRHWKRNNDAFRSRKAVFSFKKEKHKNNPKK